MELQIDPQSKVPIYVQIEEQVKALVAAGQLVPGDQLPTIRQLASDLRVNYNTVARAYLDLDRDGVISTQRGRGTFVAEMPDEADLAEMREEMLRSILHTSLEEVHRLGYTPDEVAAIFHRELAAWLRENGRNQKEE